MLELDRTVQNLGEGIVVPLASGKVIFKLASYDENPIVQPQDIGLTWYENGEQKIGAVFNCGAAVFQNKVILMARCQKGYKKRTFFDEKLGIERTCFENYVSEVWPLLSPDGVHFTKFNNIAIKADGTDHQDFIYGIEDIRIIKCGSRYLLVGCGKIKLPFKYSNADRIAIYSTEDFINIAYHGMIESFDSRNAVLFSEPVNGKQYMLLRFQHNIHLDFLEAGLDQLLAPSIHRGCWEKIYRRRSQTLLLEAGFYSHEKQKIGPGPQLIRTMNGWLVIYHAVGEIDNDITEVYGLRNKIERGYSICAALLDLENPGKVLCRTKHPIYIPSAPFELYGNDQYPVDIPAVVFPVGSFVRKDKLILYAGAGDKYIILLSCSLEKLIKYLWDYCEFNV